MSIIDALDLPDVCFTSTPQHWWSTLAPADWTPDARWGLSDRVLEPLEMLFDPRWALARAGDPAAAIALAIAYDRNDTHPALINAMMSALVANALLGSAAARLVLIHRLSSAGASIPRATSARCRGGRSSTVSSGLPQRARWGSSPQSSTPPTRRLRDERPRGFRTGCDHRRRRGRSRDRGQPVYELPRLLRLGLECIGRGKRIRERVAADVMEVAPAAEPRIEAWLSKPGDAPFKALVKWLDREAVLGDQPVLKALADAILLLSVSPFTRHRDAQARVALGLRLAYDRLPFDLDVDVRSQAAKLLIGWSMVAAGAFTTTRETHAIDACSTQASAVFEDLTSMMFQDAKAEAEKSIDRAKERSGLQKLTGAKPTRVIPPGHVLVCPQPGGNKVGSLTFGLTHIVGQLFRS